jgi:hypothetical protein
VHRELMHHAVLGRAVVDAQYLAAANAIAFAHQQLAKTREEALSRLPSIWCPADQSRKSLACN